MIFLVLIIVLVVAIKLLTSNSKNTANYSSNHSTQSRQQKNTFFQNIDQSLVEQSCKLIDTAIRMSKIPKGGAFLRISVFQHNGSGHIEHYYSFSTNNKTEINDDLLHALRNSSSPAEKQAAIKKLLDAFQIQYYAQNVTPFFSQIQQISFSKSPMDNFTVRKDIQISALCVDTYYQQILSHIQTTWPALNIETDAGDIDISIWN